MYEYDTSKLNYELKVIFVDLQVLGIKKPKNEADSSKTFRPRSSSSKFYKHLFPVTNKDHFNDKSSDEGTQNGQYDLDLMMYYSWDPVQ